MIGDPPEFQHSATDENFDRLCDAGRFNVRWICSGIRWRMIVFQSGHVNVVTAMWVFSPAKIYVLGVCVMEFVIVLGRPLDVDSGGTRTTEPVVELDFQNSWVEVVVE